MKTYYKNYLITVSQEEKSLAFRFRIDGEEFAYERRSHETHPLLVLEEATQQINRFEQSGLKSPKIA